MSLETDRFITLCLQQSLSSTSSSWSMVSRKRGKNNRISSSNFGWKGWKEKKANKCTHKAIGPSTIIWLFDPKKRRKEMNYKANSLVILLFPSSRNTWRGNELWILVCESRKSITVSFKQYPPDVKEHFMGRNSWALCSQMYVSLIHNYRVREISLLENHENHRETRETAKVTIRNRN